MSRNHKLYNYIKDRIEDKSPKMDSKEKDDNKPNYYGAIRNRNLGQNENISRSPWTPYPGKEEEYWNCNHPRHLVMPVSFAICHNPLFVTSPSTNQMQVFQDGKHQG